ncbi:MAG: methyltransferase domain-containing protein [Limnochordia bacterium]
MRAVYINYDEIADLYDAGVKADYDVSFFKEEASRIAGPVVELTSGTGLLSIPLIEAGVDLTCVDFSQGMLDVLIRKLEKRGLHAVIHRADISRLDLPERYELAILPFHSFMEIVGEERQNAALAGVFTRGTVHLHTAQPDCTSKTSRWTLAHRGAPSS